MFYSLLVTAYLLITTCAIIVFKLGARGTHLKIAAGAIQGTMNGHFVLGIALYVVSFCLWLAVLSMRPISYIVPLTTGLSQILIVGAGWWILREKISPLNFAGIGFIIVGAVLISLGRR